LHKNIYITARRLPLLDANIIDQSIVIDTNTCIESYYVENVC
jgi:hypothetical protein